MVGKKVDDEFDLGEAGSELLALTKQLSDIKTENEQLKKIIIENDLSEDIPDVDCTSIEEKICQNGIRYISELVQNQDFDQNDIKNFEVLYRTLRSIRGQSVVKKTKPKSVSELLKIVEGTK